MNLSFDWLHDGKAKRTCVRTSGKTRNRTIHKQHQNNKYKPKQTKPQNHKQANKQTNKPKQNKTTQHKTTQNKQTNKQNKTKQKKTNKQTNKTKQNKTNKQTNETKQTKPNKPNKANQSNQQNKPKQTNQTKPNQTKPTKQTDRQTNKQTNKQTMPITLPKSSKLVDAIGSFRPSNMSSKLPHPGRSSALSCSANMLRSGRGAVNSQRNDADKSATILQTVGVHFLQNFFWCLEIARKRSCYKTILVSSLREETPPTDPVLVLAIHSAILGNEWRQALRSGVISRQKSKKCSHFGEGLFLRFFPWQLTRGEDRWKVAAQYIHGVWLTPSALIQGPSPFQATIESAVVKADLRRSERWRPDAGLANRVRLPAWICLI